MKRLLSLLIIPGILLFASSLYSQKQLHMARSHNPTKGALIFGLITKEDDTYYITWNWRSRSMITYKIEGDTTNIEKYINKPVLAKGTITKASQPPRNRFILESITKCWETGKSITVKGEIKKGGKYIYFVEYPLPGERLLYIVSHDKTNSIEKLDSTFVTVKGVITQENNWNRIYLDIEAIEQ